MELVAPRTAKRYSRTRGGVYFGYKHAEGLEIAFLPLDDDLAATVNARDVSSN
jgi:hypothetical protein